MATDFAVFLHRFLTSHLAGLRGCSPNTIASYRDTFKLLITWFRDNRSIPPDKLTLDLIDVVGLVETGLFDIPQCERPEGRDLLGVGGIAPKVQWIAMVPAYANQNALTSARPIPGPERSP